MTTLRHRFRDLPITWKLILLTTVTCSVALLLASIAFAYQDVNTFKRRNTHEISTLARVVAANSAAALVFDDDNAARTTLSALVAEPQVIRAELLTAEDRLFATYQRQGATGASHSFDAIGPRHRFERGHLFVQQEVVLDGRVVGYLQIESDMDELRTHLRRLSGSLLGVFVMSVLAGVAISLPIQRLMSSSLLELANVAKAISESSDYSIRVLARGHDEVGLVTRSFNEMVSQVQAQERALQDAYRQLERKIEALESEVAQRRQAEESLRQSEEELRQAQKLEAVGLLAGGVAHDFNNLLTVIVGYSELTLRTLDPTDRLYEMTLEVKKAGDRGATLTQQLLAFSRKQILEAKVLDLNHVVDDSVKLLRRLVGEDVEIEVRSDERIGHIKVDPGQLQQILWNLAVNARDAMPRGGKLVIESGRVDIHQHRDLDIPELPTGAYATLRVRDTGCGIRKDLLERIFEPFFTTKDQGEGTGLGLSTVYGIVKQSGGHIRAESTEGEGTTFWIYLPEVDGAPLATRGPETAEPAPCEAQTILLVEDDPQVRDLARRTLQLGGYTVLTADGGEEAIRVCSSAASDIDLLLTDVIMPRMNGCEVYQRIAVMKGGVKVLFMSGHTDRAIVDRGVLREGISFLRKPFSLEELLNKVRETLDADRPQGEEGDLQLRTAGLRSR